MAGEVVNEFPLFPLGLVALPTEAVPLHIFEERYRTMIGECIDSESEFGIVWMSDDGLRDIGCACEVEQVLEEMDDGRFNVLTRGTRPFRVLERQAHLAYPAGLARGLDNADAAHFAFLLATPPILLAGLYKFSDLTGPEGAGVRGAAILAAVIAAVVSVFTVRFLTQYFKTKTLRPFGIYCLSFGAFMVVFTLVVGAP